MGAYSLRDIIAKPVSGNGGDASRVALTFDGVDQTYEQLDTRSSQLAAGLVNAGFVKGERAAVVMYNRLEWVELFFALAKVGGVVVPVNYLLSPKEIQYIVDDCQASWIVVEDVLAEQVGGLGGASDRHLVQVGSPASGAVSYESLVLDEAAPQVDVRDDDLFLLQYTSGTTGFPKGAMHTHSTVLWNSYHQIVDFDVTSDDVFQVTPALCWAAGFHDLALATLWRGGRVVLGRSTGFDPAEFLRGVQEHGVTKVLLVPTVLKRVLGCETFDQFDLSSLRQILSGGEPVPQTSVQEMQARLPTCDVRQVYGMSEFPTLMLLIDRDESLQRPTSTGKACSAAQVRVVDDDLADADPGMIGQIICRSPATMIGYYGKPEATSAALFGGWLLTGDLAYRDEDGFVHMAGRAKDMIITGGLNVYPAEVERVIAARPDVVEAAVTGTPDDKWGEIAVAHVVVLEGTALSAEELLADLKAELAPYKIPRRFNFRTEPLPRTTSGKVQKSRIVEPAAQH